MTTYDSIGSFVFHNSDEHQNKVGTGVEKEVSWIRNEQWEKIPLPLAPSWATGKERKHTGNDGLGEGDGIL